MELLLSAISTAGLAGASNQYLCLIIISAAAKLGWVELVDPLGFMESWWFIGIVAVFWILTVLPAYGSMLSPGVMNVVNTIVNFLSGFIVPASAALLSLAALGVIAGMDPELYDILQTLQIFDPQTGAISTTGWIVAGSGAMTASTLGGAKFLAKPAISAATGTTGTTSAPTYATIENLASVVLMLLVYGLLQIDPWLIVALLAVVALVILGTLIWSIRHLWKLGKGVGRVATLVETDPKAGLSVVGEFLVWGLGWLIWEENNRGIVRLVAWVIWLALMILVIPVAGTALTAALAVVPFLAFIASVAVVGAEMATLMLGLYIGARSAGALLRTLDVEDGVAPGRAAEAPVSA